ncbi:MAG TPA: LysM peptidoglycan-binding domain-containing protein [Devosia sp.]|nr:LysM peptidoglycan-binding domain-containing protein [Devosia sp.]
MAQPRSKRALLTFGSAAATVVVVAGVLSGPSVVECSSSPDGLGACLRGKVESLTGAVAPAPAATAPATPVATEMPSAPSQPAAVPEESGPALGLVSAEPDGTLVIAGTGKPGEEVTVYANGQPLGTTTAQTGGDWALTPDEKLAPGGTEITVGGPDGKDIAQGAFVVVIDADRKEPPEVLASTAGKAAEVLKDAPLATREAAAPPPEAPASPAAPAAPSDQPADAAAATPDTAAVDAGKAAAQAAVASPATQQQVATAEAGGGGAAEAAGKVAAVAAIEAPVTQPVTAPAAPATPMPDQAATDAGAAAATAAIATPVPQHPQSTQAEPNAAAADRVAIEAGQAAATAALGAPVTQIAIAPAPSDAPVVDQRAVAAGAAAAALAAASPSTQVAALPAEPGAPAAGSVASGAGQAAAELALAHPVEQAPPQVALPPLSAPTIEAVEVDGGHTFIAGAGEEGATVRVFVGDALAGETVVKDGRWLLDMPRPLTEPSQRIRAEMLRPGNSDASTVAEVDLVIDAPPPTAPAETDEVDVAGFEAGVADAEAALTKNAAAATPSEIAPPSVPEPEPPVDTAAIEAGQTAADAALAAAQNTEIVPSAPAGQVALENGPEAVEAGRIAAVAALAAPVAQQLAEAAPAPDAPAISPEQPKPPVQATVAPDTMALPSIDAAKAGEDAAVAALASPAVQPPPVVSAAPAVEPQAPPIDVAAAAKPEIPTIHAGPMTADDIRLFSEGKVIIRRGDTLWDIARRVYDNPYRYRQIYRANRTLVRRARLIYPGQVLVLPGIEPRD